MERRSKMARRYKRPDNTPEIDPYKSQPMPLGRPVAVYYRQSTEGQIGNISTTLQTVDMIEHLERQGWERDQIEMIDMDAGVSGTKKIKDRPGMSHLYELIEAAAIGMCAAQDVDRFFRDVTQIETNIFIDACRRNNVQVLTPTFVYDFAHPMQGRYHMQLFREQAQRAADHYEFHIKGRLMKSRQKIASEGNWAGRSLPLGYMVDLRPKLPDGQPNPDFRRYVAFPPYADIVRRYFELFQEMGGNLSATWRHIDEHGPFIPDMEEVAHLVPHGFRAELNVKARSSVTGKHIVSHPGLHDLLINVAYLGFWLHQGVIVHRHNHAPLIDTSLFMWAFNHISSTDFNGDPNPDYIPYRPFVRHAPEKRTCPKPTYSGLVLSDDLPGIPMRRLAIGYSQDHDVYDYVLHSRTREKAWTIRSEQIDSAIDELLLERLRATTIDDAAWKTALGDAEQGSYADLRRIRQAIKSAERTRQIILDNLKTVSNPAIVKNLEASYEANERELSRLKVELEQAQITGDRKGMLLEARPVIELVIARWQAIPRPERRDLFEAFAHHVKVSRVDRASKRLVVYWRDATTSEVIIRRYDITRSWERADLEKLRDMMEGGAHQVEIMRAFPESSWRNIIDRYNYHFNERRWTNPYKGDRKYYEYHRWTDTEEYKAEQAEEQAQNMASVDVS
jgi:DNA invertase Pin-like site-specific DNA recombinase